ncbi:MAG: IS4/IS5 family transposase, partial [Anaerolineae bacterium]|nr:IS4/IS5 family transposase [Anaerolineae bacterium]
VVAWRLLWLTYLGRINPDLPCSVALDPAEWQALYCFIHKTPLVPQQPPSIHQALSWIAQLGGFLGRKSDGSPGVKVLWRGWRRLFDITQAWLIFNSS